METDFEQVDWNQCEPQRISTSKLLLRIVLTICWMPSQLTAHLNRKERVRYTYKYVMVIL